MKTSTIAPLLSVTAVAIFAFMAFAGSAAAVPEIVERAFQQKYGDDAEPEWEVDSNGFWEAKFEMEGGKGKGKARADFTVEGKWVETEVNVEFDELPDAVQQAVRSEFGDRELAELEEVDSAAKGRFFDIEFKEKGPNEDVEYTPEGQRMDGVLDSMAVAMTDLAGPMTELKEGKSDLSQMTRVELVLEFGLNLLTIFLYAFGIYYLRHHDHKMMFLLFAFNLFLFPIFLLSTVLTAGFGFTIFALLALVRLRSENFDKAEVAYLLGAVSLTFINSQLSASVEIAASTLVLATAFVADHPFLWRAAYQSTEIRYKLSDTTKMLDREFLREKIAEEFCVDVSELEIDRVAKKEVRLTVMYKDKGLDPPSPPADKTADKAADDDKDDDKKKSKSKSDSKDED